MAHHKERLALISIFHIFDSLTSYHVGRMPFIHFTRSGIRMRIIPPCTFFYKHRVIITALSRQDIVIIKTCRFRMQMPFTEYSGLISCLLQAFRYIRMIRI